MKPKLTPDEVDILLDFAHDYELSFHKVCDEYLNSKDNYTAVKCYVREVIRNRDFDSLK